MAPKMVADSAMPKHHLLPFDAEHKFDVCSFCLEGVIHSSRGLHQILDGVFCKRRTDGPIIDGRPPKEMPKRFTAALLDMRHLKRRKLATVQLSLALRK